MTTPPDETSHPSPGRGESRYSRYRFVMAALILSAQLCVGLNVFPVSPLLPLAIEDYEINRATAGLLVSLPLLVAATLGLPSGILLARIGLWRAFTLGWLSIALVSCSALAPNFITLLLIRSVIGLGFAVMLTATGPLLMEWFRPKEILVMNALTTAVLSLGIALSVATASPLAEIMAWQKALSIYAFPGVLGLAAWLAFARTSGASHRVVGISLREVGSVLRSRAVILLLAADAGVLSQYTAFTGWLPTFYNEERGISLSEGGFITGILPFVGMFGVLAGGALALRVGSPKTILTVSGICAGLGGLGTFLFPGLGGIYPSIIIMGIGSWLYAPALLTLPMQMDGSTPERVAVVWGSLLTFTGFAMFLAPIIVGSLRDVSGSFFPGFAVFAAASWALLMAGILLPKDVVAS
ncbi:MAG TPA: hypothetical protein DCE26_08220, partial [Dehalococcoidia bacterium]|nr:hypothetical protein [Dehalococcoidia bacterium]